MTALFVAMLGICTNGLAQDANSFLNELDSQTRGIGSTIYSIVIAVLGIIAIVSLVNVGVKMYNSDQQSTDKALGWCGGIVFCFVAALAIKNFLGI